MRMMMHGGGALKEKWPEKRWQKNKGQMPRKAKQERN